MRAVPRYIVAIVLLWATIAKAESPASLRLPQIFGNNMVLPGGPVTPVWGWAGAGKEVSVTFGDQTVTTKADGNGKWRVELRDLAPSGQPGKLIVKSEDQTKTRENVIVGDVWLGSGQSNMEFPVRETLRAQQYLAQANCQSIRIFKTAIDWSETASDDVRSATGAGWMVCTPETVAGFGATLYYFGREVHDKTHRPVGLILSAVGGMNIEPFIPREGFEATSELVDIFQSLRNREWRRHAFTRDALYHIDEIDRWVQEARRARDEKREAPRFPSLAGEGEIAPQRRAAMLFNANISPLTPFAIRGVVWYQGEGNEHEEESYAFKMRALVNGWRHCWGRPELPFYFVQLANFTEPDEKPEGVNSHGYARLRMGQLMSLAGLSHVGMAVTVDITDGDLHPKNKQEIGQRLALWALKNEYGMNEIVPCGPLMKNMRIDGIKARIAFDYAESGLMVGEKADLEPAKESPAGELRRFAIAGADRHWYWAEARIDGCEVVVSSPEVAEPVAVRYAFTMNPRGCNLYNKAGLPASPFRTDKWPLKWGR